MNARKIRKLKCMIVAVLAVAAFAVPMAFGAFSDTWDVPWFDNGDGNTYTDGDGNVWGVYYVANEDYDDWTNDYSLMTWSTDHWQGSATVYGHPTYEDAGSGNARLTAARSVSKKRASALTFTPGSDGDYCWYGTLYADDELTGQNTYLTFGTFDSSNTWTSLHAEYTLSDPNSLDLSAEGDLQDISAEKSPAPR